MADYINNYTLKAEEALIIEELVKDARGRLDLGMGPIGEKIFSVLSEKNIRLLYFYLEKSNINSLEAFYLAKLNSMTKKYSYYIALNTSVPLDLLIFNICHEYYHHIDNEEGNLHLMRIGDPDEEFVNIKANRFAAEFLLPTESIKTYVRKHNRGEFDISNWNSFTLLRFISQIQIGYQVPYRMIVKRLFEISAINYEILNHLLSIDERDENSLYYKVASILGGEDFLKLNRINARRGVDSDGLNVMLRNYDEGISSIDSTIKDLSIFDKSIEEFGYEIDILEEDMNEISELLGEEE